MEIRNKHDIEGLRLEEIKDLAYEISKKINDLDYHLLKNIKKKKIDLEVKLEEVKTFRLLESLTKIEIIKRILSNLRTISKDSEKEDISDCRKIYLDERIKELKEQKEILESYIGEIRAEDRKRYDIYQKALLNDLLQLTDYKIYKNAIEGSEELIDKEIAELSDRIVKNRAKLSEINKRKILNEEIIEDEDKIIDEYQISKILNSFDCKKLDL